ncbi:MAG TPA: tol-pal system protein YbgF [Rhodanobacteraceae bacterium]|nr:tol-pal system protein YbgF [Rhodanobacteraceae bacterium]
MSTWRSQGALAWLVAATIVAAAFPLAASAQVQVSGQRLSLADRVARLERQAQDQGGVGTVNQMQALRSEVQQLQGQVEQLRHQLQQMQQQAKAQYIDLDSRLGRLEGRPAGSGPAAAASSGDDTTELGDVVLGGASATPAAPAAPAADAAGTVAPAGAQATAQADYDNAFAALRSGAYPTAARRFQAFIQQHPQSELVPNAYYWLGESYYGTQNYPVALRTFQQLVQLYPDTPKARDGLLKIGYCQYELQQWDAARATLQRVVQQYPNSSDARLAQDRLRALDLQTSAQ